MFYKIREVKLKNGNISIQVFSINKRKRIIHKHIGTAKNSDDLKALYSDADIWINHSLDAQYQKNLFEIDSKNHFDDSYEFIESSMNFAYETLGKVWDTIFTHSPHTLWKDLALTQIIEPGSKRHHIEFLRNNIQKDYDETFVYRFMSKTYDHSLYMKSVVSFAEKEYGFDFSFVLYDVTTLYFESFKSDDFKKCGFSKEHKHNQPQVVIGLFVTKEGFPLSYQIWKGNTFEGHTFIPSIIEFKKEYNIKEITVVADSAMLSKQNVEELTKENIHYIISVRLSSLKDAQIDQISNSLNKIDQESIRIDNLIVEYRDIRYRKDKNEMDKQIEKAKAMTGKKTTKISKMKYVKNGETVYSVNEELQKKNEKLLGMKGYVTDLTKPNKEIINYYRNLVKIEHAFRIAKSDLEVRPIYHFKEQSIKNHVFICFLSLVISAHLELKIKVSIKKIVIALRAITDIVLVSKLTGDRKIMRKKLNTKEIEIEKLLH